MRVYIVCRHHKEEDNRIIMNVYLDKHAAKARAKFLDDATMKEFKKHQWHGIEKYDVEDAKEDVV